MASCRVAFLGRALELFYLFCLLKNGWHRVDFATLSLCPLAWCIERCWRTKWWLFWLRRSIFLKTKHVDMRKRPILLFRFTLAGRGVTGIVSFNQLANSRINTVLWLLVILLGKLNLNPLLPPLAPCTLDGTIVRLSFWRTRSGQGWGERGVPKPNLTTWGIGLSLAGLCQHSCCHFLRRQWRARSRMWIDRTKYLRRGSSTTLLGWRWPKPWSSTTTIWPTRPCGIWCTTRWHCRIWNSDMLITLLW